MIGFLRDRMSGAGRPKSPLDWHFPFAQFLYASNISLPQCQLLYPITLVWLTSSWILAEHKPFPSMLPSFSFFIFTVKHDLIKLQIKGKIGKSQDSCTFFSNSWKWISKLHKEVWGRQERKLEIYRTTFLQYLSITILRHLLPKAK